MRTVLGSILLSSIITGLFTASVVAAASAGEECGKGLVQDIDISNTNTLMKYAFLKTIDKSNYESASQKASASGDFEITDLFKIGNAHANYDQFNDKRATYFQQHGVQLDVQTADSMLRQTVSDSARQGFYSCVTRAAGLHLWFSDDIDNTASATLNVKFRGTPGDSAKFTIDLLGGKFQNQTTKANDVLPNGGTKTYIVLRNQQSTVKATVNQVPSHWWQTRGDSDSAASAYLPPRRPQSEASSSSPQISQCLSGAGYMDVPIHAGDKIHIRAGITSQCDRRGWTVDVHGTYSPNGAIYTGPDGAANQHASNALLPSEFIGTAIGAFSPQHATTVDSVFNVMKGASPFKVGSSFDGTAPVSGYLYLIQNDLPGSYLDNGGNVHVEIEISRAAHQ